MPDPRTAAIERLRIEMQSWTSIELRVRKKQQIENRPAFVRDPIVGEDQHYIETRMGQRFLDDETKSASGSGRRVVCYGDGHRCARVTYDRRDHRKQETISISKHFSYENQEAMTHRPEPLLFYYIEKTPIYEALRDAQPLGEGKALGHDCDLFLFNGVKLGRVPLEMVYFLDRATSTPLRVEAYAPGKGRAAEGLVRVWEAKDLERVQGDHYFPVRSENHFFLIGKEGRYPTGSDEIVVEEIHYDRPYEAKTFWPTYEPGVIVHDTIKKTYTEVPGPKAPAAPKAVVPAPKAEAAVPVRAEPPTSWSTVAGASVLGLGVALVLAALVLKIRSR